jgi:hypothetical protein
MSGEREDPLEIKDRTILTLVEHKLLGSTQDRQDMVKNPFTPQAILDGRPAEEVLDARLKQREIVSMLSEYFGFDVGKLPIVALNVLDPISGKVFRGEVRLVGFYDFHADKINRDPIELSKYKLTDEGRRKLMIEDEVGRREKIG